MHAPPLPVTVTVLSVVLATNCFVDSVAEAPGPSEAIGLPGIVPSLSSSTVTFCTVVPPVLVILYVYSTSPPPAGRSVWHSPTVPLPQVSVPSFGSFRPTKVHSGDGAPVYFNVSAIAPPVQPAAGGGAGAAHAVFSTSSEQHTTT